MSGDASFFVDTNVLLYSLDSRSDKKRRQAVEWVSFLWGSGRGRLSWQVMNEFYDNAVRKVSVSPVDARSAIRELMLWKPAEMSFGIIERSWHWIDVAQVSYWDGLILAAAERAGCAYLLSEDFQAGRSYEGVTVINPFEKSPADFGLHLN